VLLDVFTVHVTVVEPKSIVAVMFEPESPLTVAPFTTALPEPVMCISGAGILFLSCPSSLFARAKAGVKTPTIAPRRNKLGMRAYCLTRVIVLVIYIIEQIMPSYIVTTEPKKHYNEVEVRLVYF
jgi:hypothetical protein